MGFNSDPMWFNATLHMLKWWEKPRWWFKKKEIHEDDEARVTTKYDHKRGKMLVVKVERT